MKKEEEFGDHFKIIMIGDSGVGKINLLSRFVEGIFSMDSKPTIGVEFATKTSTFDNKIIKTQIWDTAGLEQFWGLINAFCQGVEGAIIIYYLTKQRSF